MFSYWAPPASAPLPRRTARSMLSFGTELFLAFWIASYSVGLPAGSPPPVRAATSMFLISLANSLPRLASTTAFLCLVVAHLEWPDMSAVLPHQVHEVPMHPQVTGQLGMERRGQQAALPDRDDPTRARPRLDRAEHLHAGAGRLHPRRADEDRTHRPTGQPGQPDIFLERLHLPAEGVAAHLHVQAADRLLAGHTVDDAVRQH